MDKYLKIFSEELDERFKPETVFPDKTFYIMGWLKLKLIVRKNIKKQFKEIQRQMIMLQLNMRIQRKIF